MHGHSLQVDHMSNYFDGNVAALLTLRKKSFAMRSGEDVVREIRPVKFEGARSLA